MNSISDIWNLVLSRLSAALSETTIHTWFDEVEAVAMQDKTFFLYCPNDFKRSTIESLFTDAIRDALRDIFSSDFEFRLLSAAERDAMSRPEERKSASLLESGEYTFDSFVIGECNKLAYAASRAVADAPAMHYNPLYIYGDSGLGKTHLIYAVAHAIREKNPAAKIVYVKGDDFTNELVQAIAGGPGKTKEMREKYRSADLLLMDDVQFIAGRKQSQEEFFHTFNTLYESRRQIVLTSDRPPREMTSLDERLVTRFEGGYVADVQAPEFETRLAIIKSKAAQRGAVIGEEIAYFIAENVTANVRQLEGAMNKILAYRDVLGKNLTEDEMNLALKEYLKKNITLAPTADSITEEVARYFSLDTAIVRGKGKNREAVNARQTAIYLIRCMTGLSTLSIGTFFDRDHSTILYSLEQVEKKIRIDPAYAQTIKEIKININAKK